MTPRRLTVAWELLDDLYRHAFTFDQSDHVYLCDFCDVSGQTPMAVVHDLCGNDPCPVGVAKSLLWPAAEPAETKAGPPLCGHTIAGKPCDCTSGEAWACRCIGHLHSSAEPAAPVSPPRLTDEDLEPLISVISSWMISESGPTQMKFSHPKLQVQVTIKGYKKIILERKFAADTRKYERCKA